jgi:hypothetical protein
VFGFAPGAVSRSNRVRAMPTTMSLYSSRFCLAKGIGHAGWATPMVRRAPLLNGLAQSDDLLQAVQLPGTSGAPQNAGGR